jgi:adenylosuccinate synthase
LLEGRAGQPRIAELVGTEVAIVSTGPAREDTILRSGSAVTAWFE